MVNLNISEDNQRESNPLGVALLLVPVGIAMWVVIAWIAFSIFDAVRMAVH